MSPSESRPVRPVTGEFLLACPARIRELFPGRWPRRAMTIVLGAAFAGSLQAQVNTERLRRTPEQAGWFGSTSLDVTARTGNVDLVLIGVSGRLDYVRSTTQTFFIAAGDFGWQGGERFSNEGLLHLRQTFRTDHRLSPEVFVQTNYDRSRDLVFRGLIGAGPRLALVRTPSWSLVAATAYMFELEHLDLTTTATHPRRTSAHRWSSYLTTRVAAGRRVALTGTAYVQPRFDDLSDLRVLADLRMALELSGRVSVIMTTNFRYDSGPPDGIDPVDLIWKTGFAVEW